MVMTEPVLADQSAIVTGAGRGIGATIARTLSENGAAVALAARSEDELVAVADDIQAAGGDALVIPTDVTEQNQVENLFSETSNEFEKVDILINNASISKYGKLWEHSVEEWESIVDVNLTGVFRCSRQALKSGMLDRETGKIINISSINGKTGFSDTGAYTASKHGVQGLTNVLAKELRETDIRVSSICPGQVDTDMQDEVPGVEPLETENISDIVLFLLSMPSSVYIPEVIAVPPESIPITTH